MEPAICHLLKWEFSRSFGFTFFMNLPGLRTETIFKEKTKLLFVIPSKWESLNKMTEM